MEKEFKERVEKVGKGGNEMGRVVLLEQVEGEGSRNRVDLSEFVRKQSSSPIVCDEVNQRESYSHSLSSSL